VRLLLRVMGMEVVTFAERPEGPRLCLQKINLHEARKEWTLKLTARPRSADLCFITATPLRSS